MDEVPHKTKEMNKETACTVRKEEPVIKEGWIISSGYCHGNEASNHFPFLRHSLGFKILGERVSLCWVTYPFLGQRSLGTLNGNLVHFK